MEKVEPFVIEPWWRPPKTCIADNKQAAKELHQEVLKNDSDQQLQVYTDGSGINNKVGAAAVAPKADIINKTFMGSMEHYTIYTAELRGIHMALIMALEGRQQNITDPFDYTKLLTLIILTDNQAAIRSSARPSCQSGQTILAAIIRRINALRALGIETEIHRIPAYIGVEGNEKADQAANLATGWRQVRKRNNRIMDIDTPYTAPKHPDLPIFGSAIQTRINKLLQEEW